MSSYIYRGEREQRVLSALPEGDYFYVVADCGEPYQKDSGNWVLAVKLTIQPSGTPVFCNPWSGIDRNAEERDGIADFLCSCNRAPKIGEEPNWKRVVGAKGKCRLKKEIAQQGALAGKEVSRVHYFYRPKPVGPTAEQAPQSYTESEVKKAAKTAQAAAQGDDREPDDIPF